MGYLNLLISIKIVISKKFEFVKLNLFNHVLVLFRVKFACILAIKYPVFRWELCKDCVWESVKKIHVVCIQKSLATRSYDWLMTSKSPKCHTCEARKKLKGHDSWRTTWRKVQSGQAVNSWLIPLARLSHQNALLCRKMNFHIPHILYYKYPYTHEMLRAFRENFERETLEKTKINSSTILDIWFSKFLSSHPFHWHILERYIFQILISPYPYQWGDILVLGK